MTPVGRSTRRMRSLCESATMRSPSGAMLTPSGRVELRQRRRAVIAGETASELVIARDRLDRVVARVDAPDRVVVRIGEVQIAVLREHDAVRRVQPRVDRGSVIARVSLASADDRPGRGFAQHERARADREDHDREDDRAPEAVGPDDRRRDERRAGRARRPSRSCRRWR